MNPTLPKHLRDSLDARLPVTQQVDRVIQCSECDNREQLSGEITEQTLIDDGWLLEPVVWCPRCGPDDE